MEIPRIPGLTPAELERLAWLAEECAEVIQIIGKIQRHGLESYHPEDESIPPLTNRRMLEKEIGHVKAAIELLQHQRDIVSYRVTRSTQDKKISVRKYLHHHSPDVFLGW